MTITEYIQSVLQIKKDTPYGVARSGLCKSNRMNGHPHERTTKVCKLAEKENAPLLVSGA